MLTAIRAQFPAWRRALRRRRRTLALLAAALILAVLVPSLLPPRLHGATIVVASADLPVGTVLEEQHLHTLRVAAELAPPEVASDPAELLGRRTALTVPAGTAILPGLLDGDDSAMIAEGSALMAVPVPAVLAPHLAPGARIEILSSSPDAGAAVRIPARVVELPASAGAEPSVMGSDSSGRDHVLVALDRHRTGELAHAISEGWLTISIIG